MEFKKNAVDLTDLAVGIVILGIVVAIGANVLLNIRDNQLTDLPVLSTTTNLTLNDTAQSISASWYKGLTSVVNASNISQTVPATNYTIATNAVDGTATIVAAGGLWNGTSVTVSTQRYDVSEESWTLPNDAATGLAEYGNWFDIIVIVGVAAVILALIFMAFGNRGQSQGAGVAY